MANLCIPSCSSYSKVVGKRRDKNKNSLLIKYELIRNTAFGLVSYKQLNKTPDHIWSFITQNGADILLRLIANCLPLEEVSEVCGASTVAEGSDYPSLIIESEKELDKNQYSRFIVSGSVFRYSISWDKSPIQFTHKKYNKPYIKLISPIPKRRIEQAKSKKIIICKVGLEPRAFFDNEGEFLGAYTSYVFQKNISLLYITGILNSRLMAFLYRNLYDALAMGRGYLRFQPPQLRRLPIKIINFSNNTEEIEAADKQINQLVYELYGLTRDEINIVENIT